MLVTSLTKISIIAIWTNNRTWLLKHSNRSIIPIAKSIAWLLFCMNENSYEIL
jgi:hypothetical protein